VSYVFILFLHLRKGGRKRGGGNRREGGGETSGTGGKDIETGVI